MEIYLDIQLLVNLYQKNKLSLFPNSDYIMKNGLLIGCHQGLNLKNINYIHNIVLKFLNK